jgi:hypothetical protein
MMREAFPPRVDPSAADAAMARYDAMEPAFAEFDRISLDVEPRYLKAQLELKARKLREAEEGYGKVVLMKQAEPAVCALYKIGLMYRRFAGALLDTAVPEEIQNDPSLVEEYRTVLRQQAEPLESKAKDGFALAVNAARDYSVRNECVRRAEAMLSGAR